MIDRALAARKETLQHRDAILRRVRNWFFEGGFLEVETPLRIPAPAPEAYIDAAPAGSWFLQTSPELCMKRLLAAGHDRIFQLSRCWREGERGRLHLPEFTMLEWYRSGADYRALMDDCEGLVTAAAATRFIRWGGMEVDLQGPWERVSLREAFRRHAGTTPEEALESGSYEEILTEKIEPHLGNTTPVFVCDFPAPLGALARRKESDPTVAERFELYIAGLEVANGFSELNDPAEQRERFLKERELRRSAGKTVYPMPERFLEELAAMPPSAGIALGIDRLVMLLTGKTAIDEVVSFVPEEL